MARIIKTPKTKKPITPVSASSSRYRLCASPVHPSGRFKRPPIKPRRFPKPVPNTGDRAKTVKAPPQIARRETAVKSSISVRRWKKNPATAATSRHPTRAITRRRTRVLRSGAEKHTCTSRMATKASSPPRLCVSTSAILANARHHLLRARRTRSVPPMAKARQNGMTRLR